MSEDRKARLASALVVGKTAAVTHPADLTATSSRLAAELVHIAAQLKPHGISISALLGGLAKDRYGVTVAPYVAPTEPEPAEEKAA